MQNQSFKHMIIKNAFDIIVYFEIVDNTSVYFKFEMKSKCSEYNKYVYFTIKIRCIEKHL